MEERVNELVEKINECEAEILSIEKEVLEIDMERLNKIIQVAIRGLKFEKIYSKRVTHNNYDYWINDEYVYHKGENDKFLKGINVGIIELSYSKDGYGVFESCRELFLMDDGTFKVFYHTSKIVCYNDECNIFERKLSNFQEITQFDFDSIIENIANELTKRLEKLGTRIKTQLERLEKLKKLKIS